MKTKGEVFSHFRAFKSQVENMTGRVIKVLRIDNDGEYNSHDFIDFYKEIATFPLDFVTDEGMGILINQEH